MSGLDFMCELSQRGDATANVIYSGIDSDEIAHAENAARGLGVNVLGVVNKPPTAARLPAAIDQRSPGAN